MGILWFMIVNAKTTIYVFMYKRDVFLKQNIHGECGRRTVCLSLMLTTEWAESRRENTHKLYMRRHNSMSDIEKKCRTHNEYLHCKKICCYVQ